LLLNSLPSHPKWHRGMWNGGCGQLIAHCLCRSFLLTLFPCSSVGSLPHETVLHALLQCESFPRLQFFTNCSSVGPFHGVQSFRNRLLQHESPTGSQVLPASLIRHELLSPWVRSSWQKPAPPRGSPRGHRGAPHGVTASFGHPRAPVWGPPWAAGGYLLHRGPPWTAGAQPASPWSAPWAEGEPLLWCVEHLLPPLLHRPWCLQSCFSHMFLLLSPAAK